MKTNAHFQTRRSRIMVLAVGSVLLSVPDAVHATNYTWNNSTDFNNVWSRAQNWQGGLAPGGTNGDTLVFSDLNNTSYTAYNDLTEPTSVGEIDLNNNSSVTDYVDGNAIKLLKFSDLGSGTFTIQCNSVNMGTTTSGLTEMALTGGGSGVVSFVYLLNVNGTIVPLNCPIHGNGQLEVFGGKYVMAGNNDFTGNLDIFGGTVVGTTFNDANTNGPFGNLSADPNNTALNGGQIELTAASGTSARGFGVGGNNGRLTLDSGSLNLSGVIESLFGGTLTLDGAGTLTLSGTDDNASLGVTVAGGHLILGKTSSSTVHAIGGPLTINSTGTLLLGGTGGDQIYDQVAVTDNGTFDMNGQSEQIYDLTGTGTVQNSGSSAATLTVGIGALSTHSGSFTGTFIGNINGSLTLEKAGDGTFTIGGAIDNNALGATVDAGTLVLGKTSSSSVHSIGGPLTINSGGAVQLGGSGGDQIYTKVTVNDNGVFDLNGNNEGFKFLTGSGTVTNSSTSSDSTLTLGENTVSADTDTFNGNLSAGANRSVLLNKVGDGVLTLAGTVDNNNLSATVVSGTLVLAKTSSSTVHAIGPGLTINSTGTVQLGGTGGDQIFTNATVNDNGTFDLNGLAEGFNSLIGFGTVASSAGNGTLSIGENSGSTDAGTFSGTITSADSGHAVTLVKTGNSAFTLAGATDNGYLGATVNSGTLVLAKTSSSSVHAIGGPLLINSGGTVKLAGTGGDQIATGAPVTVNGTLDLLGNNEGFETLLGTGTVTNTSGSSATLTIGENAQRGDSDTFNGALSGNGNNLTLVKTGAGPVTLAGSTDNAFLGLVLSSGSLILNKDSSPFVHAVGGNVTINPTTTLQIGGTGGDQIYTRVTVTDNGVLDLNGRSEGFQTLLGSGIVLNNSTTSGGTLILGENMSSTDSATVTNRLMTSTDLPLCLVKTGAGTLTIAGNDNNDHLSAIVNSGTLVLGKNSNVGEHCVGGFLTINSGAVAQLAGTGDNQLDASTNLTVNAGGTFDLNGNTAIFDGLAGAGTVTNSKPNTSPIVYFSSYGNAQGPSTYSGNITDGAGTVAIGKDGGGIQTLSGADTFSGGTSVYYGDLVIANPSALGSGSLEIFGNGSVQLQSGLSQAVKLPQLMLNGSSNSWSGELDITNDKLIVEPAAGTKSSRLTDLQNQVSYGRTHAAGIVSSTSGSNMGIAVLDNSQLHLPTFGGQQVDDNSILLAPELLGDANLDGKVNALDFNALATHFGQTGQLWTAGDFNDDGVVSTADFTALANDFNATLNAAQATGLGALVPEPASLAAATLGLLALWRRGRRA
jgi:autotransporter-associated beta strand protein